MSTALYGALALLAVLVLARNAQLRLTRDEREALKTFRDAQAKRAAQSAERATRPETGG